MNRDARVQDKLSAVQGRGPGAQDPGCVLDDVIVSGKVIGSF